jgi:anti-anti-sigma factor
MGEILPLSAVRSLRAVPATAVASAFTGPGSIAVRCSGELDAEGAAVLESELERAWSCGARRVTVDLSGVTFLGLAGLHCLMRARSTAQGHHARLGVTAASGHINRLLELAGATEILEFPAAAAHPPEMGPPGRPDVIADAATHPELAPMLRALRWSSSSRIEDLREALVSVTETASAYLPGAEGAGVLLAAGPGRVDSYAATDPVVTILDLVQQRTGSGPAWQSTWTGVDVVVDDLVVDPRWPELVAETAGLDVRSLLCLHLGAAGDHVGALTVYSSAPAAFGPAAQQLGHAFASVAATAVTTNRAVAHRLVATGEP